MSVKTISNSGGNWSATTAWVEGTVPVNGDDIVATATSGNLAVNVHTANLNSFDLTGYTGILSGTSKTIIVQPSSGTVVCKFAGTINLTYCWLKLNPLGSSIINFTFGSFGSSSYGILIGQSATSTGTVSLQDDISLASFPITYYSGIFTTNNHNITAYEMTGNPAGIHTVNLGSSSITVKYWTFQSSSTLNAGSSSITMTGAGFNEGFWGGGKTYNSVILTAKNVIVRGANTFNNLTKTGATLKTDGISFDNNQTITGTLTLEGNSSINRLLVQSLTLGTARTLTCNGTVSCSNVDFMDITGAGTASWDLSGITGGSGDCGGNSGITFTTSVNQHWTNPNSGNYSDIANWTSRVPLPQDNVYFDCAFNASQTVTADMPRLGKSIDWTGATGTPNFSASPDGNRYSYGSITFISGMSFVLSGSYHLRGRNNYNFTSATMSPSNGELFIEMVGGVLTLQDNLVWSNNLYIINGTFNANNKNVTVNSVRSSNANIRTITMGSGTWALNNIFDVWDLNISTNLTLNSNTSTIELSNTLPVYEQTFVGGGKTYNNLSISSGGTSEVIIIEGSNTFNTLTINAPKTVTFEAGTTQTVSSFVATGTAGNIITINSTTTDSQATLSKSSGTVDCDYLSLQDSNATGGSGWNAGDHSTIGSNVTGWVSGLIVSPSALDLLITLETPTIDIITGALIIIDSPQTFTLTLETPTINYDYNFSVSDLSLVLSLLSPHISAGVGGYEDIGLRIYDGTETITVGCKFDLTGEKLRIKDADGNIWAIGLIDTSDPVASKIRIYDGVSTKAIVKI